MAVETLRQLVERPEWMVDAACRGEDPAVFYPKTSSEADLARGNHTPSAEYQAAVERAKAICRRCDVQAECLAYCLHTDERHGIWGGRDQAQIGYIRRQRRKPA